MSDTPSPAPTSSGADAPLCLLNGAAHSGNAEGQRRQVAEAFARLGRNVRMETPADCAGIESCAREAARAGAKLVIAGGGDGTINAVANALAGTETALAILPLGTLNHFAKDLGIPLEIESAVANAFEGQIRAVDLGEVNGRVFVNNSSIGLYPEIVRERETLQKKGQSKWTAFAKAVLFTLRRSQAIRVKIHAGQSTVRTKTKFIFIGNNEYELTAPRLGGRIRLDGGQLWVYRVPHTGRWRAIAAALRAFVALATPRSPFVLSTQSLRIETRKRSIEVAADGEVVRMHSPLLYRSRPRALQVIVPVQSAG